MRFSKLLVVVAIVAATPVALTTVSTFANKATWEDSFDYTLRQRFAEPATSEQPYDYAMTYFVTAFHDRARLGGASADQPGERSNNGREADALESFSRIAPMVAVWLASGRQTTVLDLHGEGLDLRQLLHDGITAGTDPKSAAYWGDMKDRDQRIVESADIARSLWLVRNLNVFSKAEIGQAGAWLRQANTLEVADNNWHLFPVVNNVVLRSLGEQYDEHVIDKHMTRIMEFARGDGWFSDGDNFDFYNAWALHYEFFWLRRISPGFGGTELQSAMRDFVSKYVYLIGPEGLPILGRSICYRMAAPAPLVAAALSDDGSFGISPGLARHSLDAVWQYFVKNRAVANGLPTQGYCGTDLRVVDDYTGPASCLYGLRALILAFLAPPDAPFWNAAPEPLPVEQAGYSVPIPAIGWTVVGDAATHNIEVHRTAVAGQPPLIDTKPPLQEYSLVRKVATAVMGRPFRPWNWLAKYSASVYSSADPFCGCS